MKSSERLKETLFLRCWGLAKVPLIALVGASVVTVDEEKTVIKIPLNRLTRNHLKSMYFGTLAIGADCAGGYFLARKIFREKLPLGFVFKDFKAEFLHRPEGDVLFTCAEGRNVAATISKALASGERENTTVRIVATVPKSATPDEPVAVFHLTLSMKKKQRT